jgi:hypothetical protein
MNRFKRFFTAFLLLGPPAAQAQTVSVTGGRIQGAALQQGGAVFRGIPTRQLRVYYPRQLVCVIALAIVSLRHSFQ